MVLNSRQLNNFWAKVSKTDSCWLWTGRKLNGYGKVNINSNVYNAHRVSLVISGVLSNPSKKTLGANGEIVMHLCDNRSCVNPVHLKVATQKENMNDAQQKGRKWCGENKGSGNGRAVLSEETVLWLKHMFANYSMNVSGLAKKLKIHPTQLYLIKNNKSWTHVKL